MNKIFEDIASVEDWRKKAPPKRGDKHWKVGRSAKELAKAWFPSPGVEEVPKELVDLFTSRGDTKGMQIYKAEPELVTKFDEYRGEGRNSDLVLWGKIGEKRAMVCIEAKADEAFGKISGEYVDKIGKEKPKSNIPARFSLLSAGLFGKEDEETRALRYQLLTATAGTLVEAEKYNANFAILVIHVFKGETEDDKIKRNSEDLNRFVNAISGGTIQEVSVGELVGPIRVPGNEHFSGEIPLYIGKCQRKISLMNQVVEYFDSYHKPYLLAPLNPALRMRHNLSSSLSILRL